MINSKFFEPYWSTFQQELASIIFLSSVQVWCTIQHVNYLDLNGPWNVILAVLLSGLGVVLTVYGFLFPHLVIAWLSLDDFDVVANGIVMKNFLIIWRTVIYHVALIIAWHNGWYIGSSICFVVQYVHSVLFVILLYRAAHKNLRETTVI